MPGYVFAAVLLVSIPFNLAVYTPGEEDVTKPPRSAALPTKWKTKLQEAKAYDKCPKSASGQFAFAGSCSQFLNCYKGRGWVHNCAPGTLFNPRSLVCDHPDKVECLEVYPAAGGGARRSRSGEVKCPRGATGLLPHPYDCSKFLNCGPTGQTFVQDCGPGAHFSPQLGVCDYPHKAGCANKGGGFQPEEEEEEAQNGHGEGMIDVRIGPARERLVASETRGYQSPNAYPESNYQDSSQQPYANRGNTRYQPPGQPQAHPYPSSYDPWTNPQQPPTGTSRPPNQPQPYSPRGDPQQTPSRHYQPPSQTQPFSPNIQTNPQQSEPGSHSNPWSSSQQPPNRDNRHYQPQPLQPYSPNIQSNPSTQNQWSSPQQYQPPTNNDQPPSNTGNRNYQPQPNSPNTQANPISHNQWSSPPLYQPPTNHNQPPSNRDNRHYQPQPNPPNTQTNPSSHNQWSSPQQYQPPTNTNQPPSNTGGNRHYQPQPNSPNTQTSPTYNQWSNPQQYQPTSHTPANHYQPSPNRDNRDYQAQPQSLNIQSNPSNHNQYYQPSGQPQSNPYAPTNQNQAPSNRGNRRYQPPGNSIAQQQQQQQPRNYLAPPNAPSQDHPRAHSWPSSRQEEPVAAASSRSSVPRCPPGHDGLLPHPSDCSKFLNCAQGRTFVQNCGPGTHFNPDLLVCDWPHSVRCGEAAGPEATPPPPDWTESRLGAERSHDEPDIQVAETQNQASVPENIITTGARVDEELCRKDCFRCPEGRDVPTQWLCDGHKDCQDGADEQDCQYSLLEFVKIPNHKLSSSAVEKYANVSKERCASLCLEVQPYRCRSFNYRNADNVCELADTNIGLSGALAEDNYFDYFENRELAANCSASFVCLNGKCIANDKICDGTDDCGDRTDEKGCNADAFGYKIAMTGSDKPAEGRIELEVFGYKGYICDDSFGLREAGVACRELGYPLGAVEVRGNSHFAHSLPQNSTYYLMDDVTCSGNETSLRDCDFPGWGVNNCLPQEVVGVVCKTNASVCPTDHWICEQSADCVPFAFVCDDVLDCPDGSDEAERFCGAPPLMRLANGTAEGEGRLEMRHHGIWGTVCDDDFDEKAAKVACRQMGYGDAVALPVKEGAFGPGAGPIWLDQVNCRGNETSLEDCYHSDWGVHNCEHGEDVGLICFGSGKETERSSKDLAENKTIDFAALMLELAREDAAAEEAAAAQLCGRPVHDPRSPPTEEVGFRVVAGSRVSPSAYPWQATVRVRSPAGSHHWCGAVVVARRFLLTAAHCLDGYSKKAYYVRAGDLHADLPDGTEQEALIDDFFVHEDFRRGHRMNNDIALVRLKGEGLQWGAGVRPICLPPADLDYEPGKNCTISGFGSVRSGKSASSKELRAGWVPLQPQRVCRQPSVYGGNVTEGMLCAGELQKGTDACDGDSGGPLACLRDGAYTLYGITSWGSHCGHANKPGVYVRVAHYRRWIDAKMAENA